MTPNERIKQLCKEKGIAVSKLEKDLGFESHYLHIEKSPENRHFCTIPGYIFSKRPLFKSAEFGVFPPHMAEFFQTFFQTDQLSG